MALTHAHRRVGIYSIALLLSVASDIYGTLYGHSHTDLIFFAPLGLITAPVSWLAWFKIDSQPSWAIYVWMTLGASINGWLCWWTGRRRDGAA